MTRRLFVDVESTGNGSLLWHSFVELNAKYYEDEVLVDEYHSYYGHNPKTIYTGGINYKKALAYTELGHTDPESGAEAFINWLDNLGEGRIFFVAYNCSWDFGLIKNWFKRNGIKKKYFFDPCICVMSLCACKFDKYMNLTNCARELKIPVENEKRHRAEYDVNLMISVHEDLLTSLKAA